MNSNQVQCFISSAKYLSFTQAAAELFLSPQAVSKQVIAMEDELGIRMFERNGPRLTLTESGRLYLSLFNSLNRQLNFILDDVRLRKKKQQMSLHIGLSEWIDLTKELLDAINRFREEFPNCKLSISKYTNRELLAALESGQVDCALFSGGQCPHNLDYRSCVIAEENMLLYTPDDIPAGPAREDCWGLPLLVVSAWDWSNIELRVAGLREMSGVQLSPAEKIQLPNLPSLFARMEYTRSTTLGGERFSYLAKIPGITGHEIGAVDEIYCIWLRKNENPLCASYADSMSRYLA